MPLVYDELRRLAASYLRRERPGQTLQATALVNEAYVRLIGEKAHNWQNRTHFLAIAALSMRQILVQRARARNAAKRGGDPERITLDEQLLPAAARRTRRSRSCSRSTRRSSGSPRSTSARPRSSSCATSAASASRKRPRRSTSRRPPSSATGRSRARG